MRRLLIVFGAACGGDNSNASIDAAPDTPPPGTCGTTTPWADAPALALGPTQETVVVAAHGKVYVLGGFNGTAQILDAVQVFDPALCTWGMGPALPKQVHHANAAVVDGTIYVVGSLQGGNFAAIGDVWAWNPATEIAWSTKQSMPAGTQRGSAVTGVIGGKIYVAGGFRAGAGVTEVSTFDPVANAWDTALPPLPMG